MLNLTWQKSIPAGGALLDFYTKVLGFDLIMHRDFPKWGFSVYFVAYNLPAEVKAKCMDGTITDEEKRDRSALHRLQAEIFSFLFDEKENILV